MTPQKSPKPLPRVVWDDEWQAPPPPKRSPSVKQVTTAVCLVAAGVALLTSGVWKPERQPAPDPVTTLPSAQSPILKPSAALLLPAVTSHDRRWEPDEVEVTEWSPSRAPTQPHGTVSPQPRAPTTNRQPGYLSINSTPWAELSVDGRVVGNTPQIRVTVAPGRHHVVLARDGFKSHSAWVNVDAGGSVRLTNIALKAVDQ